jgi:hypothetical protein
LSEAARRKVFDFATGLPVRSCTAVAIDSIAGMIADPATFLGQAVAPVAAVLAEEADARARVKDDKATPAPKASTPARP